MRLGLGGRGIACVVAALVHVSPAAAAKPGYADFSACAPAGGGPPTLVAGKVACQQVTSDAVGTTTAFSYYIPPACAGEGRKPCPVVYMLHGGGGTIATNLGTADEPSKYVRALTAKPPQDPSTAAEPWKLDDLAKWVPAPELRMVLIAPLARTLPGGHGPFAGSDGSWFDWNRRYGKGGDQQSYDTAAPRFETHVMDELMPYVERWFPIRRGRESTGLMGCSLGGYGTMYLGLRHPDRFASLVSSSMVGDPRLVSNGYPSRPVTDGAVPVPAFAPYTRLPGVSAQVAGGPAPALSETGVPTTSYLGAAAYGLGDPVADRAYFAGHAPSELSTNALADRAGEQSLAILRTVFDAIPRGASDDSAADQAQEALAVAEVTVLTVVMDQVGVQQTVETYPGLHCKTTPWARRLLEYMHAHLRHQDGTGAPPPRPTRFDYRSIEPAFRVWNWRFEVDRVPTEFLSLWDVTCRSLTLQGSGTVTVTPPRSCRTGVDGKRTFSVDLGTSLPVDDPVGSPTTYATTKTVRLTPLAPCTSRRKRRHRTCGRPGTR